MPVAGPSAPYPSSHRGRRARVCAAALAALAVLAAAPSPAAAGQDPTCSQETAEQVAGPTNPFNPIVPEPILQVLCGPYAGPGSNAMVVTFTAPTCWGVQGWAIYVYRDGAWQEAMRVADWLAEPLAVLADGGIREVSPVFTDFDARCLPTGGTRGRTWSWDGNRFVATAWKQTVERIILAAPGACQMKDDGTPTGSFVYCWLRKRHGRLSLDGSVDTKKHPQPSGLGGPGQRPGTVVTAGRLRCKVHRTNVTCWVRATGKGMRFTATRKATAVTVGSLSR